MSGGTVTCFVCGGDGKETCDNPDHGFINALGGDESRLGCPVCGHDPSCKVPGGGACDECDGSGKIQISDATKFADWEERASYFCEPDEIDRVYDYLASASVEGFK